MAYSLLSSDLLILAATDLEAAGFLEQCRAISKQTSPVGRSLYS